ncbi:Uncharacterised protein [Collinsella intestinalis]|nr:Uncharacterised protein [Collinsella intestinalis]
MTLPVFKAFMKAVLADTPREEFPEGPTPEYKPNSEWKFSHTKSSGELAAQQQAEEESQQEEESGDEEGQEEEPQTPTTPQPPVTPAPETGGTTPTTPQ